MRCLLVVPTFHYRDKYPEFLSFSDFPSGYGYLAAALKQAGHEVLGLNLNNDPGYHSAYEMVSDRITKALKDKPGLIGIGGLAIDYKFIKDAMSIIRSIDLTIPIVLGGGIVTNDAEYIFNLLKPDYAITGEAEQGIVRLASCLPCVPDVHGLWYWDDTTARSVTEGSILRCLEDDTLIPDYEPFDIQDMLSNYSMATRLLYRYSRPYARPFSIVASRGCPFSCTFCIHGHRDTKYQARTIKSIMAEIKETYDKYHYNVLLLLDELFAVNKLRMIEFCFGILDGRIKYGWDFDWTFQTHASAKLDLKTLELAKQAGCFYFSYGIESASPTVLASMNKKTKVSQIVEAIKLAHEANIGFGGNLIFGDIAETSETISESTDFFMRYGKDIMLFPGFLVPYPGSKLFDDCVERGIIEDKLHYYETIDQVRYNMTSMPMNEWMAWNHFIEKISQYWWGVETCKGTVEQDDTEDAISLFYKLPYFKITAQCPYCGAIIEYRNILADAKFLGVGCTKCGKKIKINRLFGKQ